MEETKPRSLATLLLLVLANLDEYIKENGCLCNIYHAMTQTSLISEKEYRIIFDYTIKNNPGTSEYGLFWWRYGEVAPRKAFIEKLILEL